MLFSINNRKSIFAGGAAVLAMIAASAVFALAQQDAGDAVADAAPRNEFRVGTYEPQRTFQSYHKAERFMARIEQIEQQFMEAQEEGNQMRMFELHQQMQQAQGQAVTEFLGDVERILPEIAAEAGVRVIALEVIYMEEGMDEPQDLTSKIIEAINRDAPEAAEPKDDEADADPLQPQPRPAPMPQPEQP